MTGIAYAAGGTAAAVPAGMGQLGQFIPLILIFVVFYFLLIRPQQKKAKEQQLFINNLKKGAKVMTSGGIYGRITGLTDTIVTLEIADNVKIKVTRGSILATPSAGGKGSGGKG